MVEILISAFTFVLGSVFPHSFRNMKQCPSASAAQIRKKEMVKNIREKQVLQVHDLNACKGPFWGGENHHQLNFSYFLSLQYSLVFIRIGCSTEMLGKSGDGLIR